MEERLDFVVSIICRRPALPILNNIKMEACGNELKRTANRLEQKIDSVHTALNSLCLLWTDVYEEQAALEKIEKSVFYFLFLPNFLFMIYYAEKTTF